MAFVTLVAAAYATAAWPKTRSAGLVASPFAWTDALSWCETQADGCAAEDLAPLAYRAPLSPKPFAAKLREALEAGDIESATGLSAELLKRDPRSVAARLVLAEAALREKDMQGFADLYFPLFDIRRSEGMTYASLLAALSDDPVVYAGVAAKLAEAPYWGPRFLQDYSGKGLASPGELIGLYTYFPRAQGTLLTRLTRAGQWDLAYIAFTEFVAAQPEAQRLALTAPFNPALEDNNAPGPFNWTLRSRSADFLQEGGVYVFYDGRRREDLLVQTMPLSPGAYAFETTLSGQASEEGGWFRWRASCAATNREVGVSDIKALGAAPGKVEFTFELADAACSFVTLTLQGVPGAFPQPGRIEIARVRLAPAVPAARGDGAAD